MTTIHVHKVFEILLSKKDSTSRETFIVVVNKLKDIGISINTIGDDGNQAIAEHCIHIFTKAEISEFVEWYSNTNKNASYKGTYYRTILDLNKADLDQARVILTKINEMVDKTCSYNLKIRCETYIQNLEDKMKIAQHPYLVARIKDLEMMNPRLEQENKDLKAQLLRLTQEKDNMQASIDILTSKTLESRWPLVA